MTSVRCFVLLTWGWGPGKSGMSNKNTAVQCQLPVKTSVLPQNSCKDYVLDIKKYQKVRHRSGLFSGTCKKRTLHPTTPTAVNTIQTLRSLQPYNVYTYPKYYNNTILQCVCALPLLEYCTRQINLQFCKIWWLRAFENRGSSAGRIFAASVLGLRRIILVLLQSSWLISTKRTRNLIKWFVNWFHEKSK